MCFVIGFVAACDVIKDIQWSQELDSIFISNYQKDPTLSWQFFGSSTGFMRQFPGMQMNRTNATKRPLIIVFHSLDSV